jgi:hypothetical protein
MDEYRMPKQAPRLAHRKRNLFPPGHRHRTLENLGLTADANSGYG